MLRHPSIQKGEAPKPSTDDDDTRVDDTYDKSDKPPKQQHAYAFLVGLLVTGTALAVTAQTISDRVSVTSQQRSRTAKSQIKLLQQTMCCWFLFLCCMQKVVHPAAQILAWVRYITTTILCLLGEMRPGATKINHTPAIKTMTFVIGWAARSIREAGQPLALGWSRARLTQHSALMQA
jgi:hypothetical protein